jgi:hypothetical protein
LEEIAMDPAIISKIIISPEFIKKQDERSNAFNNLSDKMIESNIDIDLLKKIVYATEELEKYKLKAYIGEILKEL